MLSDRVAGSPFATVHADSGMFEYRHEGGVFYRQGALSTPHADLDNIQLGGPLPPQVAGKIIPMITALQWPTSGRSYVSGSGACLGLVNEEAPYIYDLGNKAHQLIASLNAVARELTADLKSPCLWTSNQVHVNTISSVHTDSNNVGLSLIMGLGSFSGGELKLGVQTYDVHNIWLSFD